MTAPTAAGWYDDPENASAQRYWDGHAWTPQRRRKPNSTPSPRPATAPATERPPVYEHAPAAVEGIPETPPAAPVSKRPTTTVLLIGGAAVLAVALAVALALGIPALMRHRPAAPPVSQPPASATVAPKTVTVTAAPPPAPAPITTVVPPPPPPPPPTVWLSIAVSDGDGWGWTTSTVSADDAKAAAISKCSQQQGNLNCKWLSITTEGCVAIAKGNDGAVWGGHGSTQAAAEQDAVNETHGGRLLTSVCV